MCIEVGGVDFDNLDGDNLAVRGVFTMLERSRSSSSRVSAGIPRKIGE